MPFPHPALFLYHKGRRLRPRVAVRGKRVVWYWGKRRSHPTILGGGFRIGGGLLAQPTVIKHYTGLGGLLLGGSPAYHSTLHRLGSGGLTIGGHAVPTSRLLSDYMLYPEVTVLVPSVNADAEEVRLPQAPA